VIRGGFFTEFLGLDGRVTDNIFDPEGILEMEDRIKIKKSADFCRNKVLFIFIDGVGLGSPDPEKNPLARFKPKVLKVFKGVAPELPRNGIMLSNDPGMGMAGLPQSATGQAALFTGINTAKAVGRHLSGFPTTALRDIVSEYSLLKRLKEAGREVAFANTYSESYLAKIYPELAGTKEDGSSRARPFPGPGKKSVTTVMNESAGLRFRTETDLHEKNGLHMDYSNRFLQSLGIDIPLRTPVEAAEILIGFASRFDLCVYEFFFSDLVGHRGNINEAVELLEELDSFLFNIVSLMNFEESSLIVTSDHGNIEDMSVRQHTCNFVPLLLWGEIRKQFRQIPQPVPIEGITPEIIRFLSV